MGGGWQRGSAGRRGSIDIYADLLDAIDDGLCRTKVVYRANLSFERYKRYIKNLSRDGLVKARTNSPSTWAVTDRGYAFLKKHRELRGFLPR